MLLFVQIQRLKGAKQSIFIYGFDVKRHASVLRQSGL